MMKQAQTVKVLRQSALFQRLEDSALAEIASKAKLRQFFPNETIVWQGKASDALFLIVNGIVAVKKVISEEQEHIFAYLMPGQSFGEVGILENQPRSATVAAMSDVDVLVIRREDFMSILFKYPIVAVELAKLLGRYLVESNRRASRGNRKTKIILLVNLLRDIGGSTIGTALCKMLYDKTKSAIVYAEHPTAQQLLADLNIRKVAKVYRHSLGYDILIQQEDSSLPPSVRTTLMLDNLMKEYDYIVINIYGGMDDNLITMLDHANQVIVLAPPNEDAQEELESMQKRIRKHIRPDETGVLTLINHSKESTTPLAIERTADFVVPFIKNMPPVSESETADFRIPEAITEVTEACIDRLERTHQIGIFIPTTVDVDLVIDTTLYVERALNFLAERFGGATSKEAQGVWNSDEVGLVGEKVFIVHTYVTQSDLNKYLDEVIEFIKQLKMELKQEAMALEVNKKLTLI